MIRKLALLVLLLIPATASAYSGTIDPPALKAGQFVYTIPPGYHPEGMSAGQMEHLNGELSKLHNPFYVVVLKDLPQLGPSQRAYARSNGFRGDSETQRVEVTTSMLMEDWAGGGAESAYDARNSSVFVIAFNPRKFAWHPSLVAKNDLGIAGRAQDPYTAHFVRSAKTRPADYGRGIANLAIALDNYVFDQTDPTRIAQRAEAARQAAIRRRLQTAQGALDTEILHLASLLDEKEHLPADVSSYKTTLTKARAVRAENDPEKMLTEAESMKATVAVLDGYVSESKSAARAAMIALVLKWALILSILGLLIFLIVRRRSQQKAWIAAFQRSYDDWNQKVTNAHGRWVNHYLERDGVVGLDDVTGRTKELWERTTKLVDGILIRISAMQKHAEACMVTFRKGHYFRFDPYIKAEMDLGMAFDFDTGTINEADLFGGETETLKVVPSKFAEETGQMFRDSIDGWKRLQKAAEERLGDACEDLPHANIDWLFEQAEKNGIPERWFADHPLFGDDESDEAFYATLDALRETDPLAYVETVAEHLKVEQEYISEMERLVAAVQSVKTHRLEAPFDTHGTKVSPDDDPAVTISAARQAEDKLAGLLAASIDVTVVERQASKVCDLYDKTKRQGAEIKSAVLGTKGAIASAKRKGDSANTNHQLAAGVVAEAAKVHRRVKPAQDDLTTAIRYIGKGDYGVQQAQTALSEQRHLDARRLADAATGSYQAAISAAGEAVQHCEALDGERATFQRKLDEMSNLRARYERKMRGFGSHATRLKAVTSPVVSGLVDFASLISDLDRQESAWRTATRRAESNYDDEQRAIRRRREEEERRRRDEEAAARRRRSSYSSSSSSSSGGFGGGGFGGSSGSF